MPRRSSSADARLLVDGTLAVMRPYDRSGLTWVVGVKIEVEFFVGIVRIARIISLHDDFLLDLVGLNGPLDAEADSPDRLRCPSKALDERLGHRFGLDRPHNVCVIGVPVGLAVGRIQHIGRYLVVIVIGHGFSVGAASSFC